MTDLLKRAYDPEVFRKSAHQLVDILADHLNSCLSKEEELVLPPRNPAEHHKFWQEYLYKSNDDEYDFWKRTIKETIHIHHPNFMGHQVCAAVPLSGLGDLINGTLNNGSAIYEMGPVSTAMERVVIKWLTGAIGYPSNAEGILTSGGSLGNLTALLAARQANSGYDHWHEGKRDGHRPAVMVSAEAHYSISRSVQMLGWGEEAVIKIPTDEVFAIRAEAIPELWKKHTKNGQHIIAIIGNACTTSTGTYDPLEAIADFCEKHSIWFHVDGAHGGAAALSAKYQHLTKGISRADSIVIDFHKMMGVSALTTAVLFKDPNSSYSIFEQNASYILNKSKDPEWYNSAKRTVECTKNMMGIKVYAILKQFGPQFFTDYLETCYDNGKTFARIIRANKNFELAQDPQTNIVVFRYVGSLTQAEEISLLNQRIRNKLVKEGKFYIVQTEIQGHTFLRTVLMNPFTSENEMYNLLSYLVELSSDKYNLQNNE